jgi:hypothetical protein
MVVPVGLEDRVLLLSYRFPILLLTFVVHQSLPPPACPPGRFDFLDYGFAEARFGICPMYPYFRCRVSYYFVDRSSDFGRAGFDLLCGAERGVYREVFLYVSVKLSLVHVFIPSTGLLWLLWGIRSY